MGFITFEDGIVTLDGEEIKGLLQSLKVGNKVRFDEAKVDGASGKKKTPQGFEDATINMDFLLLTEFEGTCYDKLDTLNAIFKGIDNKANPKIYTVTNRHLLARGIRQIVFSNLSSQENCKTDEITATLKFIEHNPPIIRMEEAQAKTPTSKELAEEAENSSSNEPEFVITTDE